MARWGLDDYRYLAGQVKFMLEHVARRCSPAAY